MDKEKLICRQSKDSYLKLVNKFIEIWRLNFDESYQDLPQTQFIQ